METVFSGFSTALLQLFLAGLVGGIFALFGLACLILPGVYLAGVTTFALALVIDKPSDFWPAIKLSARTVGKHWGKFLCFVIVLTMIGLAGTLAFGVGIFFTAPIAFAAMMYAYEDIFSLAGRAVNRRTTDNAGVPTAASNMERDARALPETPPRFSRMAIVGASLVVLALVLWGGAWFVDGLSEAGLTDVISDMTAYELSSKALAAVGSLCLLISPLLGWIAVSQIRRSAGQLYGMWLAVFDGLFFLLLALDTVIVFLWTTTTAFFAFLPPHTTYGDLGHWLLWLFLTFGSVLGAIGSSSAAFGARSTNFRHHKNQPTNL